MHLERTSVFLDFDGTITTVDTGVYLLDRLAPPSWREIERLYKSGAIGSRECMIRQWKLLPKDRAAIETTVREVPLDDGLVPLISFVRSKGAEVTILSDGYGFRAVEVGREVEVAVVTNAIDWKRHEVLFPHMERACPCAACGTCKRSPLEAASRQGRRTVLVGDGASDFQAAGVADVVFAKGELAERCATAGIRYRAYETLHDVLTFWSAQDGRE